MRHKGFLFGKSLLTLRSHLEMLRLPIPPLIELNCFLRMSLTRLLGKLRPAPIASLYACSLLFFLPGILANLDSRPGARNARSFSRRDAAHFAIADFDGDLRPDTATIRVAQNSSQAAEYFLELQLSSGSRPAIGILGPAGGLQITPQDVNGDKVADLVITSPFDAHFVAVLLNDGKGNFKQVEASDYPDVGKLPTSCLLLQDDSTTFRLALGQNRGTDEENSAAGYPVRMMQDCPEPFRFSELYLRSFSELSVAGRSPPLV
jgi:hypothetical protein